jgi:hypothetical protein
MLLINIKLIIGKISKVINLSKFINSYKLLSKPFNEKLFFLLNF